MVSTAVTPRYIPDSQKSFRLLDALIILVFLFLALFFVRLFYKNLFQTLDSNSEPAGYVTMRINNIQRRQGDRVLWDRIKNESIVYNSDLIRVAEKSGVSFHFDNNSVELDENTMVRVFKSPDGHIKLDLAAGSLRLDTGEDGGNISIIVDGKIIEAQAGTVLGVVSTRDEVVLNVLSVTDGYALLINEDGDSYDAHAGAVISFSGDSIDVDTTNVVVVIEEIEEEPIVEPEIETVIEETEIETEEPPPVLPLPAPVLIQPVYGYILGPAELRTVSNIAFRWSPVGGANAYIFSLYHEQSNASGRTLIWRTNPLAQTDWSLTNFGVLNRGRFIWQVEAVSIDSNGVIQRRGYLAERYFTVDLPVPQVELHETRNLYEN